LEINAQQSSKDGYHLKIDRGSKDYDFIHSRYQPIEESRNWTNEWTGNPGNIILIGAGLGYFAEQLSDQSNVHILEPLVEFEVPPQCPIHSLRGQDSFHSIDLEGDPLQHLEQLPVSVLNDYKIIIHPGYEKVFPHIDEYRQLLNIAIDTRLRGIRTRYEFYDEWTQNIETILPQLEDMYTLVPLRDRYQDLPALIIGAGPSLDNALPWLREHQQHAVLIATDSSMPALFESSIQPDFIVTLDPQKINAQAVQSIPAGPALVADWTSQPEFFHWARDRIRFPIFISREVSGGRPTVPISRVIGPFVAGIEALQTGGSVSATAFDLSRHLGCDPVGLIGVDHAYSYHRATCHNTAWEMNVLAQLDRFQTLPSQHIDKMITRNRQRGKNVQLTTSIRGNRIFTHDEYKGQNSWFEHAARKYQANCLDFRSDGLPTQNWEHVEDPDELLGEYSDVQKPRLVKTRMTPLSVDWKSMVDKLDSVGEELRTANLDDILNANQTADEFHELLQPISDYVKISSGVDERKIENSIQAILDRIENIRNIAEKQDTNQ
jgi:hypothetical protein